MFIAPQSTFIYFNPRSPRGERLNPFFHSINQLLFQSTLPAGGATMSKMEGAISAHISIHAPRGGSDCGVGQVCAARKNFNPRSPRGERPIGCFALSTMPIFQSTLPAGGATTACPSPAWPHRYFNPRSPRGERPLSLSTCLILFQVFQSTLPAGGATLCPTPIEVSSSYFNPRSPRGERPDRRKAKGDRGPISIHAPRGGSDPRGVSQRPHG